MPPPEIVEVSLPSRAVAAMAAEGPLPTVSCRTAPTEADEEHAASPGGADAMLQPWPATLVVTACVALRTMTSDSPRPSRDDEDEGGVWNSPRDAVVAPVLAPLCLLADVWLVLSPQPATIRRCSRPYSSKNSSSLTSALTARASSRSNSSRKSGGNRSNDWRSMERKRSKPRRRASRETAATFSSGGLSGCGKPAIASQKVRAHSGILRQMKRPARSKSVLQPRASAAARSSTTVLCVSTPSQLASGGCRSRASTASMPSL
mmetsp:Transcript_109241/g.308139  ORF Transcript_109241/g.308139 Transcript_109241/m.308139 type:complete len:262 (+) Transcript_109241:918-1703(+)